MCGIVGILNLQAPSPILPEHLTRMLGAQQHRGPDESGVYLDDWVGLGHNRLSIIDLAGGSQPISNEDETLWIIFNGEIFNYLELRRDLVEHGHQFRTSTDTEVILHLYEEQGESCLSHLNGQFALAIWDSRKRELFLARDRIGIRPLHYTVVKDRLIFASEIKSIFALDDIPREIDPTAMDQIFTFWTTLGARTSFKNIHELQPGHFMKVRAGEVQIRKYWDIPFFGKEEQHALSEKELCEELEALILDAVRIRLRADVPVGAYLSGGLDSSGITTLVKRRFNNQLRTFGIQFEHSDFDETEFQQRMVSFLDADHTALGISNSDIGAHLEEVLWHCEKPLLRTAPVPLYLLSRTVRDSGFKVVLTGEGADEVFGGYNIFREDKIRRFWARQPHSTCRPLLLGKLYPYVFQDRKLGAMLQSFFGSGLQNTGDPLYSHLVRWQNTARIKRFFSPHLTAVTKDYNGYDEITSGLPAEYLSWEPLSRAQYLEMAVFLCNYLLSSQGDRVAMAHSVETRLPYLDYRVIEFAARVPHSLKIRVLNEKYILKKVFAGILPQTIVSRPKHPYRAPIGPGLLNGKASYLREMITDGELVKAGLFDKVRVGRLVSKLGSSENPGEVDSMALAGIISSQVIWDRFVANFSPRAMVCVEPEVFVDRRSSRGREKTVHFTTKTQRHKGTQRVRE